jgi:hypothetical protein
MLLGHFHLFDAVPHHDTGGLAAVFALALYISRNHPAGCSPFLWLS